MLLLPLSEMQEHTSAAIAKPVLYPQQGHISQALIPSQHGISNVPNAEKRATVNADLLIDYLILHNDNRTAHAFAWAVF